MVTCLINIGCVAGIAVMSVDLGTEWMKVAIVSPGVPMEIALNRDSQRKTPVAIAFRDGERQFGDHAVSTGVRFPDKCFSHFLDLLGKSRQNPVVLEFERRFPFYNIEEDPDTGGVVFRHPEGMRFTPEELLGMILSYAQGFASAAAKQPIKDVVVTVPAFFNQAERTALVRAVELAGLKLLQLIGDNTAVALNYGVFRRKEFNDTPVHMLFYDMGTGSTTATVVSYQTMKSKDKGFVETYPQLSVKGVGYDRTLGGLEFKLRLGKHFAREFSALKKASKDVHGNKRAVAKLYKEADRVKKVLSANTDHIAQVENVMEDIDFKHPIMRAEFEDLCTDLFDRVPGPVQMALDSASMSLAEIDQVILVGGSTRIPKVQQKLQEALGGRDLGKSLNADEAAALGAAYQAAYLSKGFKVKVFHVKDANLFPIQVDFTREIESNGKKSLKHVRRLLFRRNNLYPQKKVMTFTRHVDDFDFFVNYGDLSFLNEQELKSFGSHNISSVYLSGVADALKKHSGEAEPKGVKVHFRLDESGILYLDSAEALFEKTVEETPVETPTYESAFSKLGSTLGKLFSSAVDGEPEKLADDAAKPDTIDEAVKPDSSEAAKEQEGKPKDDEKEPEGQQENETEEETKDEAPQNQTEKAEERKEADKVPASTNDTAGKTVKLVALKVRIALDIKVLGRTPPTPAQIAESAKKLKDLDERDRAKLARDKARNALESFILETKDKLYTDEYEKASTEEERSGIISKLDGDSEWLEYESSAAETKDFKDRLSGLTRSVKALFDRVQEHRERPQALSALVAVLNASEVYLTGIKGLSEDDQIFTQVEIDTLEKAIEETKKWKEEQVALQEATPLHEAPKLTLRMLFEKIQLLDRETKYLLNKARLAPPKKKDRSSEGNETKETEKETQNKSTETPVPEVEEPVEPVPLEEAPQDVPEGSLPAEDVEPTPEQPIGGEHTEL